MSIWRDNYVYLFWTHLQGVAPFFSYWCGTGCLSVSSSVAALHSVCYVSMFSFKFFWPFFHYCFWPIFCHLQQRISIWKWVQGINLRKWRLQQLNLLSSEILFHPAYMMTRLTCLRTSMSLRSLLHPTGRDSKRYKFCGGVWNLVCFLRKTEIGKPTATLYALLLIISNVALALSAQTRRDSHIPVSYSKVSLGPDICLSACLTAFLPD